MKVLRNQSGLHRLTYSIASFTYPESFNSRSCISRSLNF